MNLLSASPRSTWAITFGCAVGCALAPTLAWAQPAVAEGPAPVEAPPAVEAPPPVEALPGAEAPPPIEAPPPPVSETPPEPETPAPAPAGGSGLQSLNPDLSFIADVAVGWFSTRPPLESGEHDPHNNGFTLQQLELAASSSVDPYFRFDSFIVFKVPRPPASGDPIGTGEAGGVEIEEVYATTTSLPANLQLRVGQFLTRFGRFNPTHPHTWDFVDQPLMIGRLFSPDGNRGLGVELSYLTPLPWYVEVLASVTQDSTLDVHELRNLQATAAIKQFFALSDDWSFLWGLSGAGGSDPSAPGDPDRHAQIAGTDVYLKYRPLSGGSHTIVSLQAEWFYRRREIPGDTLHDSGGFAALFWRFAQRWATAARWELGTPSRTQAGMIMPSCGPGDPGCIDLAFTDVVQRLSANLTFWPTEFSRIRLQGSAALPGDGRDPEWAVLSAFEFAVGAHGAHAF